MLQGCGGEVIRQLTDHAGASRENGIKLTTDI